MYPPHSHQPLSLALRAVETMSNISCETSRNVFSTVLMPNVVDTFLVDNKMPKTTSRTVIFRTKRHSRSEMEVVWGRSDEYYKDFVECSRKTSPFRTFQEHKPLIA